MTTRISAGFGYLRILAYLEGLSLLTLVLAGIPMKYIYHNPSLVKAVGPLHGALFLLYVINVLRVSIEQGWVFGKTTSRLLVACLLPFGTFYIDRRILSKLKRKNEQA